MIRLILAALVLTILTTTLASAGSRQADLLVVYKQQHWLALYRQRHLIRWYHVALGSNPVGAKHFEGDGKTPEGIYKIVEKRIHPMFYKSLKISYPNGQDTAFARTQGLAPGGEILIHGIKKPFGFVGSLQDLIDWTQGCVAVTDEEMDEIYDLVPVGATVYIRAK